MALAAAIWAAVTAKRLFVIEQSRERDREEAAERNQAELFASWVSWSHQPQVAMHLPDGTSSRATLAVRNGSPVPVYDVVVTYNEGRLALGTQEFNVISPTGSVAHYREIKCAGVGDALMRPRDPDARLDLRVALTFTDAQGKRWTRETSGKLGRVVP